MSEKTWFPQKGDFVLYAVASDDDNHYGVIYDVEIKIKHFDGIPHNHVFVHFIDVHCGVKNARMLCDVAKVDEIPAVRKKEAVFDFENQFHLQDGEVLVIRHDEEWTQDRISKVLNEFERIFPRNKILVIQTGVNIFTAKNARLSD